MAKQREPVIHTIQGTAYEVDIEKQVLRQTNDQSRTISFIRDMTDHGTHYSLLYDAEKGPVGSANFDYDRTKFIQVPQMTELDPEGMAAKYGRTVAEVKGLPDFDLMVDQEALSQRKQGILPQIDISGEKFIVDLHLNELRHTANFAPVISLLKFTISDDGQALETYYDTSVKMPVQLDPELTGFPDHVIRISIPHEMALDPVGAAKLFGIDEREVLRRYPVKQELQAKLIPLSETQVPALIRNNREQLQKEHQQNAKKVKPRRRLRL